MIIVFLWDYFYPFKKLKSNRLFFLLTVRGSNAAFFSLVYYSPKLVLANWGLQPEIRGWCSLQTSKKFFSLRPSFCRFSSSFLQSINKSNSGAIFYNWGYIIIIVTKILLIWAGGDWELGFISNTAAALN